MQSALVFFAVLVACATSAPYVAVPSPFLQAGLAPHITRLLQQPQNALAASVMPEVDAIAASAAAPGQIRIAGQPHSVYTAALPLDEVAYAQISSPAIFNEDAARYPQTPAFGRVMATFAPAGYPVPNIEAYPPADAIFAQGPALPSPALAKLLAATSVPVGITPVTKHAGYPVQLIETAIINQGPAHVYPAIAKLLAAPGSHVSAGFSPVPVIDASAPAEAAFTQGPAYPFPVHAKHLVDGASVYAGSLPVSKHSGYPVPAIETYVPVDAIFPQSPAQVSPSLAKYLAALTPTPAGIFPVAKYAGYPIQTIETDTPADAFFAQDTPVLGNGIAQVPKHAAVPAIQAYAPADAFFAQDTPALTKFLAAGSPAFAGNFPVPKHAAVPVNQAYAPADAFFAQDTPALTKFLAAGAPSSTITLVPKHTAVPAIEAYAQTGAIFTQGLQGPPALAKLIDVGVLQQQGHLQPVEATFSPAE